MRNVYIKKERDELFVLISFLHLFLIAFLYLINLVNISNMGFHASLSNLSGIEIIIIFIIAVLQAFVRIVYVRLRNTYLSKWKWVTRAVLLFPIFMCLFTY